MANIKITIPLAPAEVNALREVAKAEYRSPKAQAALLIRRELERIGVLLPPPAPAPTPQQTEVQ